MLRRKIFNKKGLFVSAALAIVSFLFFIYAVFQSPYLRKLPYVRNRIYALQLSSYAKKFPAGSLERVRFEAMAEVVKNGQKEYTLTVPASAFEMLSNQK